MGTQVVGTQVAAAGVAKRRVLNRLKRVEGQVRGLQRMIEEERACKEVLTLLVGVRRALDAAGDEILENYLTGCEPDLASGEQDVTDLLETIRLARR